MVYFVSPAGWLFVDFDTSGCFYIAMNYWMINFIKVSVRNGGNHMRYIDCPKIFMPNIFLNYLIFLNTSEIKLHVCSFNSIKKSQDFSFEMPPSSIVRFHYTDKKKIKCDACGDFVLKQTWMITLKNCARHSNWLQNGENMSTSPIINLPIQRNLFS